jgi:hypothetical protein
MSINWILAGICLFGVLGLRETFGPAIVLIGLTVWFRLFFWHASPLWERAMTGEAAQQLLLLLLVMLGVLVLKLKKIEWVCKALAVYTAINILIGFRLPGLFNENLSMSGCFVACCVPLFAGRWYLALPLAAIAGSTGQAQPIVLSCLAVGFLCVWGERWHPMTGKQGLIEKILIVASWVIFGFFLACMFKQTGTNGRSELWNRSMFWWWHQKHYIAGIGLGSFSQVGPVLTKSHPMGRYIWMHSDWLQVLFETGLLGLGGLSICFYRCQRWLRGTYYRPALILYGLWMLANMPMHFSASGLLGIFLALKASEIYLQRPSVHVSQGK